MGQRDPGNKPSTTERIAFVYIPAPEGSTLQGDRVETPAFIREHNITPDYAFYITNQIAKPVSQVFGLVVEKLPGVKKCDLDLAKRAKNPVDAKEKLASQLLFGNILAEIEKQRKAENQKNKTINESESRANFIAKMMKKTAEKS
jgi:hypothetical protein